MELIGKSVKKLKDLWVELVEPHELGDSEEEIEHSNFLPLFFASALTLITITEKVLNNHFFTLDASGSRTKDGREAASQTLTNRMSRIA